MPRPLWQDPYAAQSIELLQAPARARAAAVEKIGEAQARAAEQSGNANANAQLQSGAAWANGIQQAGGAIASIPGQIQQAQQASRAAAMQNLQMSQMQRQATAADRLDEIKQQLSSMMQSPDIYGEDGTINVKTLLSKMGGPLPNGDVGPTRAPDAATIYGLINPINESLLKARASANVASQHRNDVVGRMADTILQFAGSNPDSLLDNVKLGTGALIKAGIITPNQADEMLGPMIANPDSIPAILGHLKTLGTPTKPIVGKQGDVFFDENTLRPIPGMSVPEKPEKPTEASLAADLSSPDPAVRARAETAMAALKPKPDATERRSLDVQAAAALASGDMETYNRLLKVKKEMGQADDRPRVTVNTGLNTNIPGDWDKTGSDFLQTVPAQWRKTVEKIANYDEDPTKVSSMRSGMRETLMQWVNQVNPSYDASQFTNRAPTRKAFTTGTQGQQINAINTALGHIDQLDTLVAQLGNGSFTPGNAAWNKVRTIFGSDKVTNFDTLKGALSGEVASVLSKSGATVAGIKDAQEKISNANSPAQLMGYVKTQIPIMGSKLASLDYQFHQAMGPNDAFSALSPDSKRILSRMGFDPSHPGIGQNDNSGGGVKILSITPKKP